MARPEIEAALAIARLRHVAISDGDNEAYAAQDEALGEACAHLLSNGPRGLTETDLPALDELIALESQSRELLETLMAQASARLESLRQSGRANGAYLRSERFSVNGV